MKRLISLLLCLCMLFSFTPSSHADEKDTVRVYINGELLPVAGKLYMDNTVIPVRAFLEAAGFTVSWSELDNMVTATGASCVMKLWPGSDRMEINGAEHIMSCPLLEEAGTTYAPVRSIGENTGFTVDWYEKSFSAVLSNVSDGVSYYEDTKVLLPELGSVVGGNKFTRIAEDRDYGIYYTYENCTEDKAHQYGEYITSKLGYEYDSMLLGENYSKIYVYTFDDVETNIVVQKTDGVPFVYVYPDITGISAPETTQQPAVTEEAPGEDQQKEGQPEQEPGFSGEEYYPGSTIPRYNAVMDTPLVRTETLDDGETVYVYEGNDFDVMTYRSCLRSLGFYDYDMDIGMNFSITYTMVRDNQYVMIMTSMFFNEVYIVPVTDN